MKHYLNVCNVNGDEISPVDIITFGSPCQDLSVAGKREGLKHDELGDGETTRSGLFMEAVRIIKEMREKTDGKSPTFAILENVPGAFSSQKGEDFRVVLEELAKIKASDAAVPRPPRGKWADAGAILGDGWSLAYRVLDAQFHGVPQRRRRILLVADFAGGRAGEILFECSGLPGYPAASGAAGQGAAGDATGGAGANDRAGGKCLTPEESQRRRVWAVDGVSPTLDGSDGGGGRNPGGLFLVPEAKKCAAFSAGQGAKAGGIGWQEECAPTLKGVMSGGNTVPTICLQGNGIDRADTAGCNGRGWTEDVCYTLNTIDRPAVCLPFDTTQITSPQNGSNPQWGDPCHPLAAQGHPPAVVCLLDDQGGSVLSSTEDATVSPTIRAQMHGNIPAVCLDCRNMVGNTELSATLQAKGDDGFSLNYINPVAVAVQKAYTMQSFWKYADKNVASSIKQRDCKDATDLIVERLCSAIRYIVRRLTPTECARLQGFPDWWGELSTIADMSDEDYAFWCDVLFELAKIEQTARWDEPSGGYIVWREIKPDKKKHETFEPYWMNTGKPYKPKTRQQMVAWYNKLHNDGAEYKMWGNGVALPVVRVPLHEMAKLGARTLGSLFDGSGGFPLAGVLDGITPLWASEIEPYPIAVTRARFREVTP